MTILRRLGFVLLLAGGTCSGVLGGCGTATKTSVYGGLVTLADALVTATFQSIEIANGVTPQSSSSSNILDVLTGQ